MNLLIREFTAPVYGRFLTEDTYGGNLADPLSLNLYAYVMNNPLAYVDPTGRAAEDCGDSQSWWAKMTRSNWFRGTMALLETAGGAVEALAGAALCTTGVGCVVGGLMMVDSAAHMASGVGDLAALAFNGGAGYGSHNVLRNAAEAISPKYGGTVYDVTSFALAAGGGAAAATSRSASASGQVGKGISASATRTTRGSVTAAELATEFDDTAIYVGASETRTTTATLGASQKVTKVIGHYPAYIDLSTKLKTKPFTVPTEFWNRMTPAEQWAANQKFLDRAISKGAEFVLATPLSKVRAGSYLEKEIRYLLSQQYRFVEEGTKLVK